MSCFYPCLAVDLGLFEGKHKIKFLPKRVDYNISSLRAKYGDSLLLLPCGQCDACKASKARDWATRGVLESYYHSDMCFLTLTYDDFHLPKTQAENKVRVKSFIKTLRETHGLVFRYLGCGEYGSETHRIHAHLCLFGVDFSLLPSCERWDKADNGDILYVSSWLNDVWTYGRVVIGSCNYESIAYTARYTMKKLDSDDDSFLIWSNRPGLGYQYFQDNLDTILLTDNVVGDFGEKRTAPVPRGFDNFLRKNFPSKMSILVENRVRKAKIYFNMLANKYQESIPEKVYINEADITAYKLNNLERGDF